MNELTVNEALDRSNYTASALVLLRKGTANEAKAAAALESFIGDAFYELAAQFTLRGSSTVTEQEAQKLLRSVFYRFDILLLSLKNDKTAFGVLAQGNPEQLYNKGSELLLHSFFDAGVIYNKVRKTRSCIHNTYYDDAIDKEFPKFRQSYAARFDALDIGCTIDYPLLGRDAFSLSENGIMFILEYFKSLLHENELMLRFPRSELKELTARYASPYRTRFSDLPANMAEIICNNLFANLLIEKQDLTLTFSHEDADKLRQYMLDCPRSDYENRVKKALAAASSSLSPNVFAYIRRYVPAFCVSLYEWAGNESSRFPVVYE